MSSFCVVTAPYTGASYTLERRIMATARVQMKEPNGRKFFVVESAASQGEAEDTLAYRVAITVGTVIPGTDKVSIDYQGAGLTPATGSYSDATINATKATGEVVTLNLEQLPNSFGNTTTGDIVNPPPAALVTYLGSKGLTFRDGRFRR